MRPCVSRLVRFALRPRPAQPCLPNVLVSIVVRGAGQQDGGGRPYCDGWGCCTRTPPVPLPVWLCKLSPAVHVRNGCMYVCM